jgi:hypothetical protein
VLCSALLAVGVMVLEWQGVPVSFFGGEQLAEKYTRLRVLERDEDVRVLMMGPSHIDMGFDAELFTRRTGKLTFNMGLSASDVSTQSPLLEHALLPMVEPELVLWCMRDELRSRANINHQYVNAPFMDWLDTHGGYPAFAAASRLPYFYKRRLQGWEESFQPKLDVIDAFGQNDLHNTHHSRKADEAEGPGDGALFAMRSEYSVSAEHAIAVFEQALDALHARGTTVYAVLMPYSAVHFSNLNYYMRSVLTGKSSEYQRWLTATLARRGVPLINLRFCPGISEKPEYFYDDTHLNQAGAVPATELLARIVTSSEIPPEFRDFPSLAEIEAMLGKHDTSRVPLLPIGEACPMADAQLDRDETGRTTAMFARFRLDRPGAYRLELSGRDSSRGKTNYFVRAGTGSFHLWEIPSRGLTSVAHVLELAAGENLVELHARGEKTTFPWSFVSLRPEPAVSTAPQDE